ncbi:hypothetical protein H4S03_000841 [Coemansia sp. S3946]|nr:hypothetical protein H4S03_000841 [Coemansia sp. S3946]
MARINDLPNNILRLILYYATATPANRLSEWKAKLPLVAVCRTWTKLAVATAFYEVYVELTPSNYSKSNVRLLWASNVDLFISRGCILKALRLMIEWSHLANPDHLNYIVQNILKLDCVDWQNIYSLTINNAAWPLERSVESVTRDQQPVIDIARIVQYFTQSLRGIVELNAAYLNYCSDLPYLCDTLVTYYGQQLQVLCMEASISFPVSCFMRNIKVLELNLDPFEARVLPSICGDTLKVLKLYGVPTNFAWHHFRYDTFDQPIVFQQLVILHLTFRGEFGELTESEVQDKVVSGAYCCDQLSFPALKQLSIQNCTPDCDLLYADLPFPELKDVHLTGSITSIRHCCRLKLTWVRDLKVRIVLSNSGDKTEFYRVTNHFFANICIGRTAALEIIGYWTALDTDLIRWVNLKLLDIRKVDYSTVCKAIGRLPNLCELAIIRLEFNYMATDSLSVDSSLFTSADPLLLWGAKLKRVAIYEFGMDYSLSVCVGGIQALILHTGTLKKLYAPESKRQLIAEFIDDYKDRCPHLANIQLLNEWTSHFK